MYTECMLIPLRTVTVLVAATAVLGLASAAAQEDPRPSLDEARGLFYNGRYEAATAIALPYCTVEPVDLNACELATSAVHFHIRRLLGSGKQKRKLNACGECQPLMTTFLAAIARGQAAATDTLAAHPADDETRFLLAKVDLNYVWLQLATVGRRTGLKEYRRARRLLDEVLTRNPDMVRAQIARAWIDYIVDTRMPFGTAWLLGGGDKDKGMRVIREAVAMPAEFFVAAEAGFALWDMQVREKQIPAAVVTARRLARDFPENEELARFLMRHDPASAN
jgi:hypothetical protein